MQVYIVTGGVPVTSSTETLLKDGGTAWQLASNLPSASEELYGVSLNGKFIITGEGVNILAHPNLIHNVLKVDLIAELTYLCMTLMQTNGLRWVSSPLGAGVTTLAWFQRRPQITVSDSLAPCTIIWIIFISKLCNTL